MNRRNAAIVIESNQKEFEYAHVIGSVLEVLGHEPPNFLWDAILITFLPIYSLQAFCFWLNPNSDLVDDFQLNFANFDTAIKDPFVRKCRKWLGDKCKGSRVFRETYVKLINFPIK